MFQFHRFTLVYCSLIGKLTLCYSNVAHFLHSILAFPAVSNVSLDLIVNVVQYLNNH